MRLTAVLFAISLLLTPLAPPAVNFAVIGDYGQAGIDEEHVMSLVNSRQPQFIVTVGDNNYPSGEASTIEANIGHYYGDYFEKGFYPAMGNHDWDTPNAKPYLDYFNLPNNERYYVVHKSVVDLFILNSDPREPDGVTANSIQGQWLQSELASSTAKWQLVFFHHPPFSSGEHGNSPYMDWPFAAWGADAVFAGHDHDYERLQAHEIPYFVNGVGGRGIRTFVNIVPESKERYNADFGAMFVKATAKLIEFQFVSAAGEVIDKYTLFN